ncbi:MAG: nucleoside triphosphate pyrophosphohydrolase [Deltaproteobacteria bacterium]|nr:nucleoside triphosphate pyrophosphohydrolase [Deltaproteobacteria bacterium]
MDKIERIKHIIEALRGENGCPWDKRQTPKTIKNYLLEEAYELVDAIERGSHQAIKEELGDLLFLIVFLAYLYEEVGKFDLKNVIDTVEEKMIRRHPHVFGGVKVRDEREIRVRWQKIKSEEKLQSSILDGIPKALPALMLAYKVGSRAATVGFDWQRAEDVILKLEEEIEEFKRALKQGNRDRIEEELGDILFSCVNLARLLNIQPEEALRKTVYKFKDRFQFIEKRLREQGKDLEETSLKEMDALWERAKDI